MRNWNMCSKRFIAHPQPPFSFYLWGIETQFAQPLGYQDQRFHSTYEELKRRHRGKPCNFMAVFSFYLWGIETELGWLAVGGWFCFHSTYEELKLDFLFLLFCNICFVFILPMRNWNPYYILYPYNCAIRFHSTYEELKPFHSFTFPGTTH